MESKGHRAWEVQMLILRRLLDYTSFNGLRQIPGSGGTLQVGLNVQDICWKSRIICTHSEIAEGSALAPTGHVMA